MKLAPRPTESYDPPTICLHWTSAGLVALLWAMGQTADFFPRGLLHDGDWSLHVIFGFALALVLVERLLWRISRGHHLPPSDQGLLGFVGTATHYALYALLGTVVALGIANAFARGVNLFEVWALPQIGSPSLRRNLTEWHGLAANLIMIVAFVHAGAALAHHYLWHDGVLRRMVPARNRQCVG
jgi:cytochrome b561